MIRQSAKFNLRFKNIILSLLFNFVIRKNHKMLTEKTGYFAVFLNDTVSNAIQITSLFEGDILVPLFKILSSNFDFKVSSAIDIGANIGNHTVFFSDIFDKVISFEPNPLTFKLLTVNTYFIKNVKINNLGLSNTNSQETLSVLRGNIGASSAAISFDSGINHNIQLTRLDDFLSDHPDNISLIKLDVEGMEEQALLGAMNTIRSQYPIILFEQLSSSIINGKSESISLLEGLNYQMFVLRETHYSKIKWLRRLKRLPLILTNGSLEYYLDYTQTFSTNDYHIIVAIHKSKLGLDIAGIHS